MMPTYGGFGNVQGYQVYFVCKRKEIVVAFGQGDDIVTLCER